MREIHCTYMWGERRESERERVRERERDAAVSVPHTCTHFLNLVLAGLTLANFSSKLAMFRY